MVFKENVFLMFAYTVDQICFTEALKKNSSTAQVNQQEAERALSKWFTGARDRGGRRASRQPVSNVTVQ